MPVIAVLRGFRVAVPTFDAFLDANGVDETYGQPPSHFYEQYPKDPISQLFHAKLGGENDKNNNQTRLFMPQREAKGPATYAYIAYTWVIVYAQRELRLDEGEDLPKEVPPGFDELRKEILSFASPDTTKTGADQGEHHIGLFVVFSMEAAYTPEVLRARYDVNSLIRISLQKPRSSKVAANLHASVNRCPNAVISVTRHGIRRRTHGFSDRSTGNRFMVPRRAPTTCLMSS